MKRYFVIIHSKNGGYIRYAGTHIDDVNNYIKIVRPYMYVHVSDESDDVYSIVTLDNVPANIINKLVGFWSNPLDTIQKYIHYNPSILCSMPEKSLYVYNDLKLWTQQTENGFTIQFESYHRDVSLEYPFIYNLDLSNWKVNKKTNSLECTYINFQPIVEWLKAQDYNISCCEADTEYTKEQNLYMHKNCTEMLKRMLIQHDLM